MTEQTQVKPTGITIIVGLEVLVAIISLVMDVYLFTLPHFPGNSLIFFTASGLISLLLAYGLWMGKSWAWIATLILAMIGIIFWLANLLEIITIAPSTFWGSIVTIVLYIILIFYLTRPQVKAFFKQ